MRSVLLSISLSLLFAWAVYAQANGGTITGTVTDPAGAVIASAAVQAKNVESGATFPAQTTSTGNYTIPNLPPGTYDVTFNSPGFKQFLRQGLTVQVAQTIRIDAQLQVGAATESVTITAEAPLLKTETGDIASNVNVQNLDTLPMLATGASASGSSGIRNPNNVTELVPGTYYVPNSQVKINGAPSNTYTYHVEGQDATNIGVPYAGQETQASVDSIQEVAIQTSNFAPEYGSVGGGFYNVTMRSGTNAIHGTAYDYFVNEILNSATPFTGYPFTSDTPGTPLSLPRARRNDYGFTVGGPVWIPKLYNGKNKTFFFFNFEQFRETDQINNIPITVPTPDYRNGNFSGAILATNNQVLGTDPLGRTIFANEIYDPATSRTVNGQIVTDPFPNNTIPMSRMDPVALKIQNLIPLPTLGGAFNNYQPSYPSVRHTTIPGVKIDQQTGNKGHLSFYWSFTHTDSQYSPIYGASDGLPPPITEARGTFVHSHVERLNYDYTLSPTMLLHLGAGYQQNNFFDDAPVLDYNAEQQLGLVGGRVNRNFPVFTGFCPAVGPGLPTCTSAGGMMNMGPSAGQTHSYYEKPTGNVSTTWVRGNHTYKVGAEVYFEAIPIIPYTNTNGSYAFSANQTTLPYLVNASGGQSLTGGIAGFPYASFLLGDVNSFNIAAPADYRQSKQQWGVFIQDSWKATRKLTINYGLRWDYGTYFSEEYGRSPSFSPTTPNPQVGNYPGAFIFEGNGPGQCNCNFAKNYPFAIGPRIGIAYQITPKTVFRGGWGIIYDQTGTTGLGISATGIANANTVTSAGNGLPAMTLAGGIPSQDQPVWPNAYAGIAPISPVGGQALPGGVGFLDPNACRPARQNQWSIGVQQQVTTNLLVEASYVGNRGVWWQSGSLENLNGITPAMLAADGININNPADQQLLLDPLSSPAVAARGFGVPYSGFATSNTLAQSLRPFPQFGNIPVIGAPLGKTWYDSLQAKVTKRVSHGLIAQAAFTWQKSMQEGVDPNANTTVAGTNYVGTIGNPGLSKSISAYDQPFVFIVSAQYTLPKLAINKEASWVLKDWRLGALLQYASGLPIPVPAATTSLSGQLFQPTLMDRVAGQPLYNVNINCHCYDPATTFVLNPAAWVNPPQGQFGSAAPFYSDYRYARHPQENANLGRIFQFSERFRLDLRIEFTNIFNRTYLNNPSSTNPFSPQTKGGPAGINNGGFGYINLATSSTQFGQPRQGQIVARFEF